MKPGHRSSRIARILGDIPPSISTTKRTQYAKVRHSMNSVIAAANLAESTSLSSASALWRDRAPRAISASRRRVVICNGRPVVGLADPSLRGRGRPIRYTIAGTADKRNWRLGTGARLFVYFACFVYCDYGILLPRVPHGFNSHRPHLDSRNARGADS